MDLLITAEIIKVTLATLLTTRTELHKVTAQRDWTASGRPVKLLK